MKTLDKQKEAIRKRKIREKNKRIKSIMDSATKVFFSKGYLGATMDEIALGAEISKPTIYKYFKTKDDLFFSLMLPAVEDIGVELEKIETKLIDDRYSNGRDLVHDMFQAFYHGYELNPENFRIVQLFQQTGLVIELAHGIRDSLNRKGRYNFEFGRRILSIGMAKGLLKKLNTYTIADLMWAITVGVIQLEDIKGDDKQNHRFKKAALKQAEQMFVDTFAI